MKTNIRNIIIVFIIFMAAGCLGADLFAAGDVLVNCRLYKGNRGTEVAKDSVVTSYQLRPLFVGNLTSGAGRDEETKELKRIFNLADMKLMNQTRWGWRENKKEKAGEVIILNGREYVVSLQLKRRDAFRLEVHEKGKEGYKELLGVELDLPQKKTAVFGFEDSVGKPYFLSFHREADAPVIRKDMASSSADTGKPKLLSRAAPVYDERALRAKVQGDVILNAVIDTRGNVAELNVLHGHPLLRRAALDAVKQWKYQPYMENGKPKSLTFTITVTFRLKDADAGKTATSSTVPDNWPTRGHLTSGFGMRIHPITGKKVMHNGLDIAAREGTPVTAAADGVVIAAMFRKARGNLVTIDHRNGYVTSYTRMQNYKVKKGDNVKKGQVIGAVGNTGQYTTAAHLHYEIRDRGKPIDPMSLIKNK